MTTQLTTIPESLNAKEVFTVNEASQYTGMSKSYLYKLMMRRQIPHYKSPMGKKCFFNRQELINWLQSNRVATDAELSEKAQRGEGMITANISAYLCFKQLPEYKTVKRKGVKTPRKQPRFDLVSLAGYWSALDNLKNYQGKVFLNMIPTDKNENRKQLADGYFNSVLSILRNQAKAVFPYNKM